MQFEALGTILNEPLEPVSIISDTNPAPNISYSLPDPQLSDFIHILQIRFEYIDHIVSGNRMPN
jgi:hypothetical protein